MKFFSLAIFVGVFLAARVSCSVAAKSSNNNSYRATIISGDAIILKSAHSKYSKLSLNCTTSGCQWTPCQSNDAKVSSPCLQNAEFNIIAQGETGKPIKSGDKVALISTKYGPHYKLTCNKSSTVKCHLASFNSKMTGNNWLIYNYATFQIFSKDAEDSTPVQNGDVVGFKYLYSSSKAWLSLTKSGKFLYPRRCSRNDKASCAKEGTFTGFKVFKKS